MCSSRSNASCQIGDELVDCIHFTLHNHSIITHKLVPTTHQYWRHTILYLFGCFVIFLSCCTWLATRQDSEKRLGSASSSFIAPQEHESTPLTASIKKGSAKENYLSVPTGGNSWSIVHKLVFVFLLKEISSFCLIHITKVNGAQITFHNALL